jgi:hypothetical protein
MVRRTLSFLMSSALLLAGLALAAFEIAHPDGLRPYVLVGAGLMMGAKPSISKSARRPVTRRSN